MRYLLRASELCIRIQSLLTPLIADLQAEGGDSRTTTTRL